MKFLLLELILAWSAWFAYGYFVEWLKDWATYYAERERARMRARIRILEDWHREHP